MRRFVRQLLDRGAGVEDDRAMFPGGGRAVHITQKQIYRTLDIPDVRHRRGKDATTQLLMRRLLSLDYVIEHQTLGWLPTEHEKVQRFQTLGIDRAVLPYRSYGEGAKAQKRFFALKFPIAVDAKAATFVYVDPGLTTESELRAWGVAHAPLWAALRARTFAVHVVPSARTRRLPTGPRRCSDPGRAPPTVRPRRTPPARRKSTRRSNKNSSGWTRPFGAVIASSLTPPVGFRRSRSAWLTSADCPLAPSQKRTAGARLTAI